MTIWIDYVIFFLGVGIPVFIIIFLIGWLVGFAKSADFDGWGKGYDDGWNAYKEFIENKVKNDG